MIVLKKVLNMLSVVLILFYFVVLLRYFKVLFDLGREDIMDLNLLMVVFFNVLIFEIRLN